MTGKEVLPSALASESGRPSEKEAGAAALPAVDLDPLIPQSAFLVAHFRSSSTLLENVASNAIGGALTEEELSALRAEIDEFVQRESGLKITAARSITFAMTSKVDAIILIHGAQGTPSTAPQRLVQDVGLRAVEQGTPLWWAVIDDAVAVGTEEGIATLARTRAGSEPRLLGSGEPLEALFRTESEGAVFVVALTKTEEGLGKELGMVSAERMALRLGSNSAIRLKAEGTPEQMKALEGQIRGLLTLARVGAEGAKSEFGRQGTAMGVMGIWSHHATMHLERTIVPKLSGGQLTLEPNLPLGGDPTVLILFAGVASAIAIPALTKYLRRAKTSEAKENLARLFDSFSAYAVENQGCKALPDTSCGVTPPLAVDCNRGMEGKCHPGKEYQAYLWTDNEAWKALDFSIDEAHAFHYDVRYVSDKGNCMFTVQAFGDLDADGVFSTFERSGLYDGNQINAAAGLFIDQEAE